MVMGSGILWARFSERQGRRQAGLSLVELLVALAILALVITLPLVTMSGHRSKMAAVDENGIAWQVIANEVELQRQRPFSDLRHGARESFLSLASGSELATLAGSLRNAAGTVTIAEEIGGVAQVTMTLHWGPEQRRRRATLTILRADAPGGTFW